MKNQQNISQLENHKISASLVTKINGGEKKAIIKGDEEIE
ncbi:hypothetical protein IMCC3317_31960 [Kordia antarctica]|uniref:Uncharacterized protein n=1 Tax=Kordia antarctica TaxID=1218801 RepID=A0A7L4ZM98_9FLAO|nr:hypothetical protein IMCC3317_31960 [Kordia antarctica]